MPHYRIQFISLLMFFPVLLISQGFEDVSSILGPAFNYTGGQYGGGVSFADWDQDGWDDLSVCQVNGSFKFFRNNNGEFESYAPFFASSNSEGKMLTWVDYDNDGDRDCFVTFKLSPHKLFRCDGPWIFTDVSMSCGIGQTFDQMTYGHAWGDYDRDGFLDLYICNYNGVGTVFPNVKSFLYRNNGNGTFTDMTNTAGVPNACNYAFQPLWIDVDQNLYPDLLIINDRIECPNVLYKNNGDGTFTNVSIESGIGLYNIFAMSNSGADYDNDGDLDVYITNGTAGNLLHQNDGSGNFSEVATTAMLNVYDFCWAAQWMDYDNDGWQDLHVACTPHQMLVGQDKFYRNNGNGTFGNYTTAAGFNNDLGWSRGTAMGDYNNDGHPDLMVSKASPSISKLWKCIPTEAKWIKVSLKGTISNRDGVGSWIKCYAGNNTYTKFTFCGEAYLSQNSFSKIFGLGAAVLVDSVEVTWPSGIVDKWYNLPANSHYTLIEGSSITNIIQILGDTALCPGEDVTLFAGNWESYIWSNGSTEPSITVSQPGNYYVTVTNAQGLNVLAPPVNVSMFESPIIVADITSINCNGMADGSINLQNISNTGIAAVSWSNGQQGATIQNLTEGDYQYNLTDNNGCIAIATITLIQPSPLQLSCEIFDAPCYGQFSTANCTATGGTPPYNILWGSANPNDLQPGDYTIWVTDSHGCSNSISFSIEADAPIAVDFDITDASAAYGLGSACATVTGGTEPYTLMWSNGQEGQCATSLYEGTYVLSITDSNGCSTESPVVVQYNRIDEITADITYFPNPATNWMRIENLPINSAVQLFDLFGRSCLFWQCTTGHSLVLDMSTLITGAYVMQVSHNQMELLRAIIIKY